MRLVLVLIALVSSLDSFTNGLAPVRRRTPPLDAQKVTRKNSSRRKNDDFDLNQKPAATSGCLRSVCRIRGGQIDMTTIVSHLVLTSVAITVYSIILVPILPARGVEPRGLIEWSIALGALLTGFSAMQFGVHAESNAVAFAWFMLMTVCLDIKWPWQTTDQYYNPQYWG